MKKIIAVFDGLKYSESTRDYAIQLARQPNVHLVGVFLEDPFYHSYKIYDLVTEDGGGLDTKRKHLDKKDLKTRAKTVVNFEVACRKAGVSYSIHKDRQIAMEGLLMESAYADLLIIDSSETLSHHPEKIPTHFIHHLLEHVQCPVFLVPSTFKSLSKVMMLFDGEHSSIYAIKMLGYTLEMSSQLPVEVLTVNSPRSSFTVPDSRLMKEFMKDHFSTVTYTVLKGYAETEIAGYLRKQKENTLVVLGAYGRGKISRWFHKSLADTLTSEMKLPFFIAHNK